MGKHIDLTFKSGIKDNEMRELLNELGFYKIPIRNYKVCNDGPVFKEVEVVYITPKESRMLVIIVKIDEDTYHVQVVAWYDNENSYTSQMVRTIKYFAELSK